MVFVVKERDQGCRYRYFDHDGVIKEKSFFSVQFDWDKEKFFFF